MRLRSSAASFSSGDICSVVVIISWLLITNVVDLPGDVVAPMCMLEKQMSDKPSSEVRRNVSFGHALSTLPVAK
jgi:hypothetical protein